MRRGPIKQMNKLLRPDRRGRLIVAHRRLIGQSGTHSFLSALGCPVLLSTSILAPSVGQATLRHLAAPHSSYGERAGPPAGGPALSPKNSCELPQAVRSQLLVAKYPPTASEAKPDA